MTRRFTGTSTHKVDAKGRVSIPASFRRVLEALDPDWTEGTQPSLYLLFGDHRRPYITAYSAAAMNEVFRQIEMMPRGSVERGLQEDYYYGESLHMTVDDSGRLSLSKELRDQAGITDTAVFKSSGDTFKIMPPAAAEPARKRLRDYLDAQADTFDMAVTLPKLPPLPPPQD